MLEFRNEFSLAEIVEIIFLCSAGLRAFWHYLARTRLSPYVSGQRNEAGGGRGLGCYFCTSLAGKIGVSALALGDTVSSGFLVRSLFFGVSACPGPASSARTHACPPRYNVLWALPPAASSSDSARPTCEVFHGRISPRTRDRLRYALPRAFPLGPEFKWVFGR